ncbi:MAG: hypothetical protein IIC40_08470, partial [Candidatus Marinimicrobia bacterium]|nr:hypothetical protein [Candidatus Neomarinimicrobiota bacterium]
MEFQDEWGYKVDFIKIATLYISSGSIGNVDVDEERGGIQAEVINGHLEIIIIASDSIGSALLEISAGGLITQIPVRYFVPEQPLILVGTLNSTLATNNGNFEKSYLSPFAIGSKNVLNFADSSAIIGGRVAFYAKGNIAKGVRVTASLDTDRQLIDQLFEDVDPNEQYPLFGDASTILFDAQTRSKFYTKIERHDAFLLIGDFNTGFTDNEFTAYNRTFNGLLTEFRSKHGTFTNFLTTTDRKVNLEEIRGEGISGFYYLEQSNITRFSEKLQLITRDRYHSEKILKRTDLTRYLDYTLNYVDGTLMFKQPVPSVDGNGNQIFIVISYENRSESANSLIGGARYNRTFKDNLYLGATLITEERAKDSYWLYGLDSKLPLTEWLSIKSEFARSKLPQFDAETENGTAFRTEILLTPNSEIIVKSYYRNLGDKFTNPSQIGSAFESGTMKYGLNGSYNLREKGRINTDFYRQSKKVDENRKSVNTVFNINYNRKIGVKDSYKLGFEMAKRERPTAVTDSASVQKSNLLFGSYTRSLKKKVRGTLEHQQNLSNSVVSKPTNSSLKLAYDLTDRTSIFLLQRLVYTGGLRQQSVFGFDSKIAQNTEMRGKYEIGGITGDARNRASIGLNNKWQVRPDLTFNTSYENSATIDSFEIPTPDHEAISIGVEYVPAKPYKAISKFELNSNRTSRKRVVILGGDARIWRGFGVIAKIDIYSEEFKAVNSGKISRTNIQAGIAYRPERNDKLNAIAKLAKVRDDNSHVVPTLLQDRLIFSTHLYWELKANIGIGARYAMRLVLDEEGIQFSNKSKTTLLNIRTEYHWDLDWSAIVDMRILNLSSFGERSFGLALEIDRTMAKNTQVGLGYEIS